LVLELYLFWDGGSTLKGPCFFFGWEVGAHLRLVQKFRSLHTTAAAIRLEDHRLQPPAN